jgi:hypothetical protein
MGIMIMIKEICIFVFRVLHLEFNTCILRRDSSVGIATGYGLDDQERA